MSNAFIHIGTKQEILALSFLSPFFYTGLSVYFIMSSIQFNTITMLYIVLQKIFLVCFRRIDFSYPFRSAPFDITGIYFEILCRFPLNIFLLYAGSAGNKKLILFNSFSCTLPNSIEICFRYKIKLSVKILYLFNYTSAYFFVCDFIYATNHPPA